MNYQEFLSAIAHATVSTQSEAKEGTLQVYFSEFSNWPEMEFRNAVTKACRAMNRFPTVASIYANRSVNNSTGHLEQIQKDEKKYKSIFHETMSKRIPPELAQLTDDELHELFAAQGLGKNSDFHITMYRKGNCLYVEQIQTALKKRNTSKMPQARSAG